jgi:hypothetical protein
MALVVDLIRVNSFQIVCDVFQDKIWSSLVEVNNFGIKVIPSAI